MPSWYDYIPVAGSVARLAQGDFKQAGIDAFPIVGPAVQGSAQAFDEKRKGLQQAQQDLGNLAAQDRAFQMRGLQQAEGYYQPAANRINAIYGAPGSFRK